MKKDLEIPIMNVRDIVIYPKMQLPLMIGRQFSVASLKFAAKNNGQILIVTQKSADRESVPGKGDMFSTGVVCRILKIVSFPDKSVKALIEGLHRAKVNRVFNREDVRFAACKPIRKISSHPLSDQHREEVAELLLKWNPRIAINQDESVIDDLCREKNSERFIGKVLRQMSVPLKQAGSIDLAVTVRQKVLEMSDLKSQVRAIKAILRHAAIRNLRG